MRFIRNRPHFSSATQKIAYGNLDNNFQQFKYSFAIPFFHFHYSLHFLFELTTQLDSIEYVNNVII